jgi:hypothetical protein
MLGRWQSATGCQKSIGERLDHQAKPARSVLCETMTMTTGNSLNNGFSPEVRAIFDAGPVTFGLPWRDYVREFQLSSRHVSELLRIVITSGGGNEETEVGDWAAMPARRALGELRASDAIEPLITLSKVDDAVVIDLPIVAGMVRPSAIPHLVPPLRRTGEEDNTIQLVAVEALALVGKWHQDITEDIASNYASSLKLTQCSPEASTERWLPPCNCFLHRAAARRSIR